MDSRRGPVDAGIAARGRMEEYRWMGSRAPSCRSIPRRSTCADADARAAAAKYPGSPLIVELGSSKSAVAVTHIEDVDSGGYVSFSCGEEAFRQIERDADAADLIT